MLVKIVRHKGGARAYAVAVDARGNVTWSIHESHGGAFAPEVAARVAAHYQGLPNAGGISFENAETGGEALPSVNVPEPNAECIVPTSTESAERVKALTAELERLQWENAHLKSEVDGEMAKVERENADLLARFDAAMVAKNGEIGELKLKYAELEALLADAK